MVQCSMRHLLSFDLVAGRLQVESIQVTLATITAQRTAALCPHSSRRGSQQSRFTVGNQFDALILEESTEAGCNKPCPNSKTAFDRREDSVIYVTLSAERLWYVDNILRRLKPPKVSLYTLSNTANIRKKGLREFGPRPGENDLFAHRVWTS